MLHFSGELILTDSILIQGTAMEIVEVLFDVVQAMQANQIKQDNFLSTQLSLVDVQHAILGHKSDLIFLDLVMPSW